MKVKKIALLFILFLPCLTTTQAQNPFAELGYTPKIATLSNGKYIESFKNDSLQPIGDVIYCPETGDIAGFLPPDSILFPAAVPSRWLSTDPLMHEFSSWHPYNFVLNNPIRLVDPDGRKPMDDIHVKNGVVFKIVKNDKPNILIFHHDAYSTKQSTVGLTQKEQETVAKFNVGTKVNVKDWITIKEDPLPPIPIVQPIHIIKPTPVIHPNNIVIFNPTPKKGDISSKAGELEEWTDVVFEPTPTPKPKPLIFVSEPEPVGGAVKSMKSVEMDNITNEANRMIAIKALEKIKK